jgi:hypothetical protein
VPSYTKSNTPARNDLCRDSQKLQFTLPETESSV